MNYILLRKKDIGKILHLSGTCLQKYLQDADFPAFKLGGEWRCRPNELEEWLTAEQAKGRGKQHV